MFAESSFHDLLNLVSIMRLLQYNDESEFSLTEDYVDDIPRYAILSHRWGGEEVTFRDLMDGIGKSKAGYDKIRFCGEQAKQDVYRQSFLAVLQWNIGCSAPNTTLFKSDHFNS